MRNVINRTSTDVTNLNVRDAVDPRPTFKWVMFAIGALALCGILFSTNSLTASKALSRLLLPFRAEPWPRLNHLAFVDAPKKVARGSDLRLALIDEASNLPQHVDLQVWYDGESKSELDTIPMRQESVEDNATGSLSTQMTFERTNVSRSFRYRAVGGDDQTMTWQKLEVVDAPRVVAGEIKLLPPQYTGWLPKKLSESSGGLRVLQGTEAVLSGTSDRSLKQVELLVSRSSGADNETKFVGNVAEGNAFEVPSAVAAKRWLIEKTSEYSLSLTDVDNTSTVDADRWTVRVVRDERPTLKLLEPDNEELITPTAQVPIVCEVEDDLAVRDVYLRYLRTDKSDAGETSIALFEAPARRTATAMPEQLPPPRDQKQVRHSWSLEPLKLAPGAVLSFHLVASDYKDQINQTLARRLVVVTQNDLIDRVGRRQSLVLSRLEQRLKQQRQAKQGVDAALANVQETNKASKSTMDRLQSSLMTQRQVNSALVGDEAEVTKELRRLRAMLDRSQIGEVDVRTRVEKTLTELKELGEADLDPALRLSTNARQTLQAERDQQDKGNDEVDGVLPPEVGQEVTDQLANASKRQDAAVAKLESLLDDLSAWDNYRKFGQELSDLLRQQRDIQRQTQEVAKESLSRSGRELDGNARAAQRGAAARQLDLARRTDRTLENLAKAEQELREKDPNAAQLVKEAIQRAREEAVSGKMREAGRQIDQNRLGQASQQQQDAASTLEDMLDELSQRSYSPEQRVEKMEETGRELERLQKRQSQLTQDFAKAERETDSAKKKRELERLQKRQEQIAKEVRKVERQLARLRSQQSSQQAGQAAGSAESAADAAEQGDAEEARQQSQLAEAQMEQAQQSLEQQKEEAKTELAQEQAIRLPQLIEALIAQQQSVVDEVKRLNDIRLERGNLSKAQEASITVTAEAQRTVAQDTALVAKQMKELPVFVFALNEVEQLMLEVSGSLDRLETADSTQQVASRVLDELKLIMEMLKRDPDAQQESGGGGQGGGSGQEGGGGQGDGIDPRLAQLKLLRGMQISINDQTKQMNTMTGGDPQARQLLERQRQSLANRQGQLGEIIGEMFKPPPQRLDAPSLDESEPVDGEESESGLVDGLDALDQELELLLQ